MAKSVISKESKFWQDTHILKVLSVIGQILNISQSLDPVHVLTHGKAEFSFIFSFPEQSAKIFLFLYPSL